MNNYIRDLFSRQKENGLPDLEDGIIGEVADELKVTTSDSILLKNASTWQKSWADHYPKLQKIEEENEKYWLGDHYNGGADSRPQVDNLIWEALETFLPIATRQNPEPVVSADDTPRGISVAKAVNNMLIYHATENKLKLRIKRVVRYWALYRRGIIKVVWSMKKDDIELQTVRPQELILDPDAYIDDDMTYQGKFIGHQLKETASNLISRFPKKEQEITKMVKGKLATQIGYKEWWTDDMTFWVTNGMVLGKLKNPHYNYNREEKTVDENGEPEVELVEGKNHFKYPQKPFIFLSVYNLGKRPYDASGPIDQNLANQDIINKRSKQIDKNVDDMNAGYVVSGDSGITKEQAQGAMRTLMDGGALYIPKGDPSQFVYKHTGGTLSPDVYNSLHDSRNELRNIFGTRGSTPQGTAQEQTVRGKMIIADQDSSRIGGGVSVFIEAFADQVFNWITQLMYVHYDEKHVGSILGADKAREYAEIQKEQLWEVSLSVGVKENSMIPKDALSRANQAVDLASAGFLDPITLFDKLDYPNPQETAERLFKQQNAPELLYPEVIQEMQAIAPPMPPEGIPLEGMPPQGLPTGGLPI